VTVPTTTVPSSTKPTATTSPANTTKTTATATDKKALATRLVLVLGERRVYAYQEDKVLASYPVAVGKKGWETPTGNFKVIQKVKDPVWQNPWNGKIIPASLNGPIGIRWIGFWTDGKNTIGFHGTPGEHLLGQAVSHGCVRMKNKDVVALFEMIESGTPVIVKNK
jgi:lipoprotein-anchoring transpeptidase ErfK/SrfK